MEIKHNQTFFHGTYLNVMSYFFIKIYYSDFQNCNFSVLWLRWTQTTEMKYGAYSNLKLYIFLWKNVKEFQWLSKSFLLIHDCSEPKQRKWNKVRHFSWDILKSDIIFHWSQNTISIALIIGIFQWDMWKALKEVGYIKQWKIHEQQLTSLQ